jgi:hypothetical protein
VLDRLKGDSLVDDLDMGADESVDFSSEVNVFDLLGTVDETGRGSCLARFMMDGD